MKRLIVATSNPGKAREIQSALSSIADWVVEALPAGLAEIEETGATFLDNAILKAAHYSRFVDGFTVADDSGLSVDALGGRPGVHSARYAPTPAARNERLLREMAGIPDRAAQFACALAVAAKGTVVWTVEKHLEGWIVEQPAGSGGFGYDPVFFVPPLGKTMAELTTEQKNHVSARGLALAELERYLAFQ